MISMRRPKKGVEANRGFASHLRRTTADSGMHCDNSDLIVKHYAGRRFVLMGKGCMQPFATHINLSTYLSRFWRIFQR